MKGFEENDVVDVYVKVRRNWKEQQIGNENVEKKRTKGGALRNFKRDDT